MLGLEPGSSERAARALNCGAIFPVPRPGFKYGNNRSFGSCLCDLRQKTFNLLGGEPGGRGGTCNAERTSPKGVLQFTHGPQEGDLAKSLTISHTRVDGTLTLYRGKGTGLGFCSFCGIT